MVSFKAEIAAETVIRAEPDSVWRILLDVRTYSEWNRFMLVLQGEILPGRILSVQARLSNLLRLRFAATIIELDPPWRLTWVGRLPVPGLFTGVHTFDLKRVPEGVRFLQRECYSGLLVPVMHRFLIDPSESGFRSMNEALKVRAEHEAADPTEVGHE
ncbi:MAG TPA: SRPBCC domain-containing protein [Thermoleophilia bacterium]|nr:SRPBCC domain-containing protein [Thermoleophilia bacterium]